MDNIKKGFYDELEKNAGVVKGVVKKIKTVSGHRHRNLSDKIMKSLEKHNSDLKHNQFKMPRKDLYNLLEKRLRQYDKWSKCNLY